MKKGLFFVIFLISTGFFVGEEVYAGTEHNVSGWAWSENIGWISFNNTSGGGSVNYGINVDFNTGNFSGFAWSENIGWIDFAPAGPYPASPNYSACLDLSGSGQPCDDLPGTNTVGGWARALSYGSGWDGWIKLRGSNYGVNYASQSGALSGWAWSDAVIGWINFRGSTNYGVIIDLDMPNNNPPLKPETFEADWNRCAFKGGAVPTLSWTYSDPESDLQSAYEIEVDENDSFSAPKFNHKVNLPGISYVLNLYDDDENPDDLPSSMQDYKLDWNSTYFWRVRVWDSFGGVSPWSDPSKSKTDKHASPWVVFNWTPAQPTQGEIVEFNPDGTEVFGGGISSYLWTITQGTGDFIDGTLPTSQYPHIIFSTLYNKMKLAVTDTDGYSCESDEQDITILLPLPEYKEVPPTAWLERIFNGILAFIF